MEKKCLVLTGDTAKKYTSIWKGLGANEVKKQLLENYKHKMYPYVSAYERAMTFQVGRVHQEDNLTIKRNLTGSILTLMVG